MNTASTNPTESVYAYVARLQSAFATAMIEVAEPRGEITINVPAADWHATALSLRDQFNFDMCVDICGADYLSFGQDEWETDVSNEGFSRGVEGQTVGRFKRGEVPSGAFEAPDKRFAAVANLLSVSNNQRVRLVTFAENNDLPVVDSLTDIWIGTNWFEREAFDMYGIIFQGHPDLRRILTDYGFVGFPFRKDFPLIGNVEVRYDETQRRVIYEPVTIEPRVTVPRVIRDDARFATSAGESAQRQTSQSNSNTKPN